MNIIVLQPTYFAGTTPDAAIAEFLMEQLNNIPEGSLVVFPEYSNAGGLSDPEQELKALPRAKEMLKKAQQAAQEQKIYVAINVLEERDGNLRNSTYLYNKNGDIAFVYDKIHLPPSEISLNVKPGDGSCVCEVDGIRYGFMTCYDIYYNEQIEFLAKNKPDIIIFPVYQRGERTDIIRAQAKLTAFRCNAYVARSSYSMNSEDRGGCAMIVSPDGTILEDLGNYTGKIGTEIDPKWKYMRSAGFGGGMIRNDDFIGNGLMPEVFQ